MILPKNETMVVKIFYRQWPQKLIISGLIRTLVTTCPNLVIFSTLRWMGSELRTNVNMELTMSLFKIAYEIYRQNKIVLNCTKIVLNCTFKWNIRYKLVLLYHTWDFRARIFWGWDSQIFVQLLTWFKMIYCPR